MDREFGRSPKKSVEVETLTVAAQYKEAYINTTLLALQKDLVGRCIDSLANKPKDFVELRGCLKAVSIAYSEDSKILQILVTLSITEASNESFFLH